MMQIDPRPSKRVYHWEFHKRYILVKKSVFLSKKVYVGPKMCILVITNWKLPDCIIVECECQKKRPGRYRNKGRTFGLESAERIFPEVLGSLYN